MLLCMSIIGPSSRSIIGVPNVDEAGAAAVALHPSIRATVGGVGGAPDGESSASCSRFSPCRLGAAAAGAAAVELVLLR